jgi:hypothetical protein
MGYSFGDVLDFVWHDTEPCGCSLSRPLCGDGIALYESVLFLLRDTTSSLLLASFAAWVGHLGRLSPGEVALVPFLFGDVRISDPELRSSWIRDSVRSRCGCAIHEPGDDCIDGRMAFLRLAFIAGGGSMLDARAALSWMALYLYHLGRLSWQEVVAVPDCFLYRRRLSL